MSDSKSTEEQLEDLIDVLDGPAGFVKDLNDLISKRIEETVVAAKIAAANEILEYRSYKIGEGAPRICVPKGEIRRFVDEFDITGHINSWKKELAALTNQTNKGEE